MYKSTIFVFLLTYGAYNNCLFAQPKNAHVSTPISRKAGNMSVVDTTRIRVWYAFNADDIKNEDTYIDCQRLDVGKRVIKYYSEFLFRSDSLIAVWKKKNPGANSMPTFLGNGGKKKSRWSEYEYSDIFISNGKLTEYASMPSSLEKYNSHYTESYPLQQWKIGTETQTILGHKCQKATCRWRGRDFVAWFTSSIPVKAGPWKFGGLPGLILKLQDTDGLYRFEAVQRSHFPSTNMILKTTILPHAKKSGKCKNLSMRTILKPQVCVKFLSTQKDMPFPVRQFLNIHRMSL